MAKTLARITGVALKPGTSRNQREYTREAIAAAVDRANQRIETGDRPLTMLTHHDANDASTHIVGRVTKMTLAADGSAMFEAELADTEHARTIANLVDPTGGDPYLRGVSIRGSWMGPVKRKAVNGQTVEYADDLELDGLDFTKNPGVDGASVQSFHRLAGTRETDARTLIFESAADVTFTEAATDHAVLGCDGTCCEECGVNAAAIESVAEKGAPALKSGKPAAPPTPGASSYADPGFQGDRAKRFPLDTRAHARAAWSYIHQAKIAKNYTEPQLKRIKAKIAAALKKFGVKVDPSEGWILTPAELVTEAAVAEMDMWPDRPGCYAVSIDNGMFCISITSTQVDPADLEMCARAAMDGACTAYKVMDPDMDGDTDMGPDDDEAASHPDDDAMESAPREGAQTPAESAGATDAEENAAMADPTTQAAPAAAAAPIDAPQAQEVPAVEHVDEPKLTLGQVKDLFSSFAQAMREPALAGAAAESAPAEPAVVVEAAPVAEVPVQETQEQLVARLVAEGVRSALQSHVEQNGVTRKGLVAEAAVPGAAPVSDEYPESWPRENGVPVQAHKMTAEQWKAVSRDTLPAAVMNAHAAR